MMTFHFEQRIRKTKIGNIGVLFAVVLSCLATQITFSAENSQSVTESQIDEILKSHLKSVTRLTRSSKLKSLLQQHLNNDRSINDIKRISTAWNTNKANKTKLEILDGKIGKFVDVRISKSNNVYSRGYVLDTKGVVVGASPLTRNYWKIGEQLFVDAYNSGSGKAIITPRTYDEVAKKDVYWIAVPVKGKLNVTLGVLVMGIKANHVVVHAMEDRQLAESRSGHHPAKHHAH